ncbi:MAG: Uma2 family endonuclease [bacterium]
MSVQTQTIPANLKYTYEDYQHLPEDRNRYEIIDGELYMTPSPLTVHQYILTNLGLEIGNHVTQNNSGRIFWAPLDVLLSPYDIVQPDILFISNKNKNIITEKNIQGAPDLVVEILSSSTKERDLGMKKKLYARSGVREYWIIDPEEQKIEVFSLSNHDYKLLKAYQKNQLLSSSVLPGLSIPLSKIFPD